MNREFPYNFDAPRLKEMETFLNRLLRIVQENSLYLSDDMVYGELKKYGLKSNEYANGRYAKVDSLFPKWINKFENVNNIEVFNTISWKYFCQFRNNGFSDEYIKLYIPLDKDHIEEGVNDLFSFIALNNIEHESKVATDIRSDNVIVRLKKGDFTSLELIMNYIKSNSNIQNGLNKVNPFIPCINGIGIMNETGISYNEEISIAISHYINKHRKDIKIDLDNFIKESKNYMYKDEVINVFNNAIGKYNNQELNQNTKVELNKIQKCVLLNEAINETLKKYGPKQVEAALYYAITQNNYGYFTNGNKNLRNELFKYVSQTEMLRFVGDSITSIQQKRYNNVEEMIHEYTITFYGDICIQKFDEMCEVTRENHGNIFAVNSIHNYINTRNVSSFSRLRKNSDDQKNYRENTKYVSPEDVLYTIKKSLEVKGNPTKDLDYVSLLKKYISELEKYYIEEEKLQKEIAR